jgi:hypothetical protein
MSYYFAQTNAAGYTALHVAAAACAYECVAELLHNGALVGSTDIFGNTALHVLIAASDAANSVSLLLSHRADPNFSNDDGNSSLHIAALHNRHSSLQHLLLHGGDTSVLNVYGLSPHALAMRRCRARSLAHPSVSDAALVVSGAAQSAYYSFKRLPASTLHSRHQRPAVVATPPVRCSRGALAPTVGWGMVRRIHRKTQSLPDIGFPAVIGLVDGSQPLLSMKAQRCLCTSVSGAR